MKGIEIQEKTYGVVREIEAPQRILVVDDEPDLRDMLKRRLSASGYEVVTAKDGRSGLKAARALSPDLIVMDVVMPGMDGAEAAARLRDDPATREIPVLFLTCLKTGKDPDDKDAGPSRYMGKPYDGAELLDRIQALL